MSLLSSVAKDREFLSKIIMTCCSRGFAAFGTVALNLVLGRVMGAAGVGLFMLAFALLTGLSVVARFGMDLAILRFAAIAYSDRNGDMFRYLRRNAFVLATILSLILAGGLYGGREWLAGHVFGKPELSGILSIMAIVLPFYAHVYLQATFLQALRQPALAPFFEPGSVAFFASVIILLSYLAQGVDSPVWASWSLLGAAIASFTVGQFALARVGRRVFAGGGGKVGGERPHLYATLPDYAVISVTSFAVHWGSVLILGAFVPAEQVGLFSVAHRFAFVVNFFLNVFSGIIAPQFASLYQQGMSDELKILVRKSTTYMALCAASVVLFIVFFADLLLGFFGPEFVAASPYLICLAGAQFVSVAIGSAVFLLIMTGAERCMRNIVVVSGVAGVVLNLVLCPIIGAWGATIATAGALVMQKLLAAWWVWRTMGIQVVPCINRFCLKRAC